MKRFTVFHNNQLYAEHDAPQSMWLNGIPERALIHCKDAKGIQGDPKWLRKDLTPVLLADVPKETRALLLLLS